MKTLKSSLLMVLMVFTYLAITASSLLEDSLPKTYENFSLYDYNQKLHSLNEMTYAKGIVIMFVSVQCPVSNAYNERMANLNKEYGSDFTFIGINSNKAEDIEEIKNHSIKNNLEFVILKDSNNVIADKFEASTTPEVYVLNNNFEQLYHGRIDDSRKSSNVEVSDLKNVLEEIKAGKEVSVTETKAFGCSIKRVN